MKRMNYNNYVVPKPWIALLIVAVFGIFPVMMTYLLVFDPEGITDMKSAVMLDALFWVIVFIIFHFLYGRWILRYNQRKKQLAESGLLKIADDDFNTAEIFFEDRIRVGEKFIFVKGNGEIILITDVNSIRRQKTIYTGDRHGTDWDLIAAVKWKNVTLFCTSSFSQKDWVKITDKLSALNPEMVIDMNIETKQVYVAPSDYD